MSALVDEDIIREFEVVKEVISNIRSIRLQKNIAQKEALELQVIGENPVVAFNAVVTKMCNLSSINVVENKPTVLLPSCRYYGICRTFG